MGCNMTTVHDGNAKHGGDGKGDGGKAKVARPKADAWTPVAPDSNAPRQRRKAGGKKRRKGPRATAGCSTHTGTGLSSSVPDQPSLRSRGSHHRRCSSDGDYYLSCSGRVTDGGARAGSRAVDGRAMLKAGKNGELKEAAKHMAIEEWIIGLPSGIPPAPGEENECDSTPTGSHFSSQGSPRGKRRKKQPGRDAQHARLEPGNLRLHSDQFMRDMVSGTGRALNGMAAANGSAQAEPATRSSDEACRAEAAAAPAAKKRRRKKVH
eukprot:TRINITY_DN9624_c0_g1_i1.p1 TRINITY_DN9624_c0_g1~~TRINITY_DN9624_c0_g1_i1.p1  ORF type:complete len:265 (+),score=25.01 TRINITY_DN9624_c0_g1_i1:194-988(+)